MALALETRSSCLAIQVHMVVSSVNMWANLQKTAVPAALDWQLEERAAWLPFFGADALPPRHLGTLQPPIGYTRLDKSLVLMHQSHLLLYTAANLVAARANGQTTLLSFVCKPPSVQPTKCI